MNVMNEVHQHFEVARKMYGKDRVLGTFLYGSQNYKIDTENSDVDTKTLIMPSLSDLAHLKEATNIHHKEPEFSGIMEIKDFRVAFKEMAKGSFNGVELLFTDYHVINPDYYGIFAKLIAYRERIVESNSLPLLNSVAGMAHKLYHLYTTGEVNVKVIVNLIRLSDFLVKYFEKGETYKSSLVPFAPDVLKKLKSNNGDVSKLHDMAAIAIAKVEEVEQCRPYCTNEPYFLIDAFAPEILRLELGKEFKC